MGDVPRLRQIVQEIEDEIEEVSTSAAAGAYLTPNAFTGKSSAGKARRRKLGATAGYTVVPDHDDEDGGQIDEARSHYANYKLDDSATPKQKIGRAISEINKRLREIHDILDMNARLKTEQNMEAAGLWKRSIKHLTRMENTIQHIANRIRELKA